MTSAPEFPATSGATLSIAQRRLLKRHPQHSTALVVDSMDHTLLVVAKPHVTFEPIGDSKRDTTKPACVTSRWSPDTSYADTCASNGHLSRDSRYLTAGPISSLSSSSSRHSSWLDDCPCSSSDSSIDIVHARRETVKRVQPHKIRWQSGQVIGQDSTNTCPSDGIEAGMSSGQRIVSDSNQNSGVTEGSLPSLGLVEGRLCDSPVSIYQEKRQQQLISSTSTARVTRAELGRAYVQPYYTLKQSLARGEDEEESRDDHSMKDLKDTPTFLVETPSSSSPSHGLNNKTSFFHHSSLRRHNSTGNYTRAQLSSQRLADNQSSTGKDDCDTEVKGSKAQRPGEKTSIREMNLLDSSDMEPKGKTHFLRRCEKHILHEEQSSSNVKPQLDLHKVNELLSPLSSRTSRLRSVKAEGKRARKVSFNLTGLMTLPPTPPASFPSSPCISSKLKKVQSYQPYHCSVPNSPQRANCAIAASSTWKPSIKLHLSLTEKLFSGIKQLR